MTAIDRLAEPGWRWMRHIERVPVDTLHEARTDAVETLLVVLQGTFDMIAGGGSWPARGVRSSPFEGRPVCLFLPPGTRFRLAGSGEILLVGAVQPEQEEKAGEASSRRPLLALAGSGKAFDPATGEWKLQESFPSSPQALLPRHIEEVERDGVVLRRVFPYEFKALSLCLDELVLPAGGGTTVPGFPVEGYPDERAAWFDAPGGLEIGGRSVRGRGSTAIDAGTALRAGSAPAFVAIAAAGRKLRA